MTATMKYCDWLIDSTNTVEEYVGVALTEYGEDFDTEALTAAFRAAINEQLPDGVELHGDIVYGPVNGPSTDLAAAVGEVDFWAIAERFDKTLSD